MEHPVVNLIPIVIDMINDQLTIAVPVGMNQNFEWIGTQDYSHIIGASLIKIVRIKYFGSDEILFFIRVLQHFHNILCKYFFCPKSGDNETKRSRLTFIYKTLHRHDPI